MAPTPRGACLKWMLRPCSGMSTTTTRPGSARQASAHTSSPQRTRAQPSSPAGSNGSKHEQTAPTASSLTGLNGSKNKQTAPRTPASSQLAPPTSMPPLRGRKEVGRCRRRGVPVETGGRHSRCGYGQTRFGCCVLLKRGRLTKTALARSCSILGSSVGSNAGRPCRTQ
ncbi:hypothetical protein T484DRAFT_1940313 [Baffinella frigidus]|nr:hypothetical protein T484DRAFT_1940313 [Cryptophyta sp. CCMP2293]